MNVDIRVAIYPVTHRIQKVPVEVGHHIFTAKVKWCQYHPERFDAWEVPRCREGGRVQWLTRKKKTSSQSKIDASHALVLYDIAAAVDMVIWRLTCSRAQRAVSIVRGPNSRLVLVSRTNEVTHSWRKKFAYSPLGKESTKSLVLVSIDAPLKIRKIKGRDNIPNDTHGCSHQSFTPAAGVLRDKVEQLEDRLDKRLQLDDYRRINMQKYKSVGKRNDIL